MTATGRRAPQNGQKRTPAITAQCPQQPITDHVPSLSTAIDSEAALRMASQHLSTAPSAADMEPPSARP